MKKRVIYMGSDPNLRGLSCEVIKKEEDMYTLSANEPILGKIKFKAHATQIKRGI